MEVVLKKKYIRWTSAEVKRQGVEKHNGKYTYDKVVDPVKAMDKIWIYCTDCKEEFNQTINKHMGGQGCKKCAGVKENTREDFLRKATGKFGEKYDYSIAVLSNKFSRTTVVEIACNDCGNIFPQKIADHLDSTCGGCLVCAGKLPYTPENLVKRARAKHGDKYDYSMVSPTDKLTKNDSIIISCNTCKYQFTQIINNHVNSGYGCSSCSDRLYTTKEIFIRKATLKHGDDYDYSLITDELITDGVKTIVDIICNKCKKIYKQRIHDHLNGRGCRGCNKSYGEKEVSQYLDDYWYDFEREFSLPSLPLKRFDFVIHNIKCLIEFDGLQHFDYVEYFHKTLEVFEERKMVDVIKSVEAMKCGYTLIRISYTTNNIREYLDKVLLSNKRLCLSDKNMYIDHISKILDILPDISDDIE